MKNKKSLPIMLAAVQQQWWPQKKTKKTNETQKICFNLILINHKITYDIVMKKTPLPPAHCPSFQKSGGNATALRRPYLANSSHSLAALLSRPTCPDVCVQQSHAAKRQYCNVKWTFEDLLPCYCYTIKTNSKTTRSQAWQPAPGLTDENCN